MRKFLITLHPKWEVKHPKRYVEESKMGSMASTRLEAPSEQSVEARYESLIRIAASIRAQKEPRELFGILVHELGHFWAGKFFDVKIEVFSFGFGPRLFGVQRGETDFRLSALLFGGYVKFAGDQPGEIGLNPDRQLQNRSVGAELPG